MVEGVTRLDKHLLASESQISHVLGQNQFPERASEVGVMLPKNGA